MKALSVVVLAVAAAGCAIERSATEISSLDYGPYPTEYKDIIQRHVSTYLRDPYSAVFEYRGSVRSMHQKASLVSKAEHGWGVCVDINAKNAFGGYVGARPWVFLIRNGRVVDVHGSIADNIFDAGLAKAGCEFLTAR